MSKIVRELSAGYIPSEDEEFMNSTQREYFRRRLLSWKSELLSGSEEAIKQLQEEQRIPGPDLTDRASYENDLSLELHVQDRVRKLMDKIDAALLKIEEGTYGYCDETGEPIELKRLIARPVATLCLDAQERHERDERSCGGEPPAVTMREDGIRRSI
jgi:DnaK suppressor protein